MKKLSQFLKTLPAVVIVLTMASCNKEQTNTELAQGEATLARIMDFKQQVDYYKANPAIKDGETMTLDEAIWNIEALFNLTYAYPELSYGHTVTADTVLYLPVGAGNTVLLTDLTVFYGQMYDVVRGIYQGIELDNKQFLILDVEAGALNGGQQAIKLHSVQGSVKGAQPEPEIPQIWEPFEEGPDWCYGENRGMINGDFDGEKDAADTLASMLNAILVPQAPNGQTYIFSDITKKELPSTLHMTFSHNFYQGEYCEFYINNATENDKWLNTSQMNFQYYGERHLIMDILPNYEDESQSIIPSDYKVYVVTIDDYQNSSDQGLTIGHHTKAYYGQRETIYYSIVVKSNL